MNKETFKSEWTELKGLVREKWVSLTTPDVETIKGNTEILMERIQERYGYSQERAEQEVGDWMKATNVPEPRTVEV